MIVSNRCPECGSIHEDELQAQIAQLTAEIAEWRQDAERLIQLANFNNARAGEYFDLHEQLVKKGDPVPDPNIMFCPNCECDRETVLYSEVRECTVCREGFEVVCGIKQSKSDVSVTQNRRSDAKQ